MLAASTSASQASSSASAAKQSAMEASGSATLAKSWANGGTGVREGEDTDNAKYWATVAAGSGFVEVGDNGSGTLLALILGNAVPGCFTVGTASNYSDMPASIVGGYSANGVFFPASDSVEDYGVFLWQVRNAEPSKYGRVWYRAIRSGAWNNDWKLLSAETDAKTVAAAVYEEMAAAYNEGVMSV